MKKYDFTEFVIAAKQEVKGEATPEQTQMLYAPENREMWLSALRAAISDAGDQFLQQTEKLDRMRKDAQIGMASQAQYKTFVDAYELWVKKANRYKLGLQDRVWELSAENETRLEMLLGSIRTHRLEVLKSGDVRSPDSVLWRLTAE